ncbi:MAG TPA: DUF2911 domain-containing protein [Mucilaginibacter sp.]|nr:DUF2911 domain-containing protein [Mucilaginibacter sp.]
MKKIVLACIILAGLQLGSTGLVRAQLTALPDGGNKRASVSEQIGLADVTIHYNRPAVKKREGHIWGELVPVGFVDQGFGTSKSAPWRAGANECTSIEFSTDVNIEGQPLAAGKYGFFIAYAPDECTLIFSKNSTSWGSFFYRPDEDALRVKVKPIPSDKDVEWLKYEFTGQTPNSAVIQLEWEKLIIPFSVETDVVKNQLASFRQELRTEKGFSWESWDQAAQYCVQNNANLEEALTWTNNAVGRFFGGSQSFQAWSTRANVLKAMGRPAEAADVMKKAMPMGSVTDLYSYGRTLSAAKRANEALVVYKYNYDKHPDEFFTNAGLGRGYSGVGDFKNALVYLQKAENQAPNEANKAAITKQIKSVQEGKDFN